MSNYRGASADSTATGSVRSDFKADSRTAFLDCAACATDFHMATPVHGCLRAWKPHCNLPQGISCFQAHGFDRQC